MQNLFWREGLFGLVFCLVSCVLNSLAFMFPLKKQMKHHPLKALNNVMNVLILKLEGLHLMQCMFNYLLVLGA